IQCWARNPCRIGSGAAACRPPFVFEPDALIRRKTGEGSTEDDMRAIPIAASYTAAEEIANSITHGIGVLLAIAGTAVLISSALRDGGPWHVAGVVVFGVGMVLLYASSMLYHSIHRPRIKAVLRILDHSAIYILIAGTYTPFTLVNLRGS